MYSMIDTNNPIVLQMIRHEKEVYIANQIVRLLRSEGMDEASCDRIIKIVKERTVE